MQLTREYPISMDDKIILFYLLKSQEMGFSEVIFQNVLVEHILGHHQLLLAFDTVDMPCYFSAAPLTFSSSTFCES